MFSTLTRWLPRSLTRGSRGRAAPRPPRRTERAQLGLEGLEDRLTPTAVTYHAGPPTSQSLYVVYLAPNIQDTDEQLVHGGFGGYHWNFGVPTGPNTGQGVSYAVVPFPVPYVNNPGDPNVLTDQTIFSSHELA